MKKINIVFFGDSICAGTGLSVHKGWITRLSSYFEKIGRKNDCDIVVTNMSLSGSTTRDALLRMPYHIQGPSYDIIVVQFGLNDANRWKTENNVNRVSPKSFEANLHEIILRAEISEIPYIFLNTNHIVGTGTDHMSRAYSRDVVLYNSLIREAVRSYETNSLLISGLQLIDIAKAVKDKCSCKEHLLKDGVHLSEVGHSIYYRTVKCYIENVVKGFF